MSFRACCRLLALLLVFTVSLQTAKAQFQTRTFKVTPDFLAWEATTKTAAAKTTSSTTPTADPFGPDPTPATSLPDDTPPTHPVSARQTLEAVGLTFPEGASASFNPLTGILTVTNSPENLVLAAAYTQALHEQEPATVAYTLTVIEGPGELIRQANATASKTVNAFKQLSALLDLAKQPGSNVSVVADAFLETKSGTRATLEAVREHNHSTQFTLDAKSRASVMREMRQLGLRLEIEPTVDVEGTIIKTSLSLSHIAAPPAQRQVSVTDPVTAHAADFPVTDFSGTQIVTSVNFFSGDTQLIGVTKPVGTPQENADILCAAFLTATLRRVEALPISQPKAVAPPSVPPGMIFTALSIPRGKFDPSLEKTPTLPAPSFLAAPSRITLQEWFIQQGVTFPAGSSIKHRDDVLSCVNTLDNIALIVAITERELSTDPKTVAFSLHTVEAPASLLRALARQTLASADDSAMFAAVEAAASRGEATFINSTFLETTPGYHSKHQAVREHSYLDSFGTDAQGRPKLAFGSRLVGSLLEVEPILGADGRTVELTFSHELHPTSPVIHRDHFRDPASQQPFDIPLTDFNFHKTLTTLSLTKGSTKLIALNPPTDLDRPVLLWATFLQCAVVSHSAKYQWQSANLETSPPAPDPKAWSTRAFRVPRDFLTTGPPASSGNSAAKVKTPQKLLVEAGISFPEGASAIFIPRLGRLFVKNTNENLDLVEAYTEFHCNVPSRVTAFTTHVLQGPGPLLRRLTAQAATKSDHRAELDELLATVKTGKVQHLNTARIETKSGTRASCTQAHESIFIADVNVNEKGEPYFTQEMRPVGLTVELEPTVGSSGLTVELTLSAEFHTAPPYEHREHLIDTQGRRLEFPLTDYFTAKTTTSITIPSGSARLLSLYKPTGKPEFDKEDILQAIFITCDILRPGE